MKVLQTIPHICNESSGPTYYMLNMCRALARCGVDVETHSLVRVPEGLEFSAKVYPMIEFPSPSLARSPEMCRGVREAAKTADIIHNNSLWMMPNVYPYWAAKGTKAKVVTSPHGTLSPWALNKSRIKKAIFGALLQYPALRTTDMFHATCEKEYEEIRAAGFKQPVAIITIGMDVPNLKPCRSGEVKKEKKIVFLGRVHKVKGVDNLILGFEQSGLAKVGWRVEIAGPDGGARADLERLIGERHIANVTFLGEVNGDAKYQLLASAEVSVLPSHTENFGVSVTESLACGTPVIASTHTPWQGLVENGCGWWVANDPATLADTLCEMAALKCEDRLAMGRRGIEWIKREFVWPVVGAKMKQAYEWLLKGGDKPEFVRVN